MKENCRRGIAALVLALALSSSAFAEDGEMHTGITSPPPPPPTANGAMHTEADGIMHTEVAEALTEVGLNLLQGLLTLY